MKKLIVHADDLGLCRSQNDATLEAISKGLVTSTSIMATCPGFEHLTTLDLPSIDADFGVHLTLTSEWPNCKWGPVTPGLKVPSLVDAMGNFRGDDHFHEYQIDQVELELTNQIEKVLSLGISISHLDCHMFCLYRRADFMDLYLKLAKKYNVPGLINKDYLQYFEIDWRTPQFKDVFFTDRLHIALPDVIHNDLIGYYQQILKNVGEELTVLLIHPANDGPELRKIMGDLPDWGADWRHKDFEFFTSEACRTLLSMENIELVNWKQIISEESIFSMNYE